MRYCLYGRSPTLSWMVVRRRTWRRKILTRQCYPVLKGWVIYRGPRSRFVHLCWATLLSTRRPRVMMKARAVLLLLIMLMGMPVRTWQWNLAQLLKLYRRHVVRGTGCRWSRNASMSTGRSYRSTVERRLATRVWTVLTRTTGSMVSRPARVWRFLCWVLACVINTHRWLTLTISCMTGARRRLANGAVWQCRPVSSLVTTLNTLITG